MFQGTLAAAQGGNFWQAAGIAVASSGIASYLGGQGQEAINAALENGGAQAAQQVANQVAISQALTGAFVGGFSSEITGGSFVQGFATGLTVAGLNHALHSIASKPIQDWRQTPNGRKAQQLADEFGGNASKIYKFLEKHPIVRGVDDDGNKFIEFAGLPMNEKFGRMSLARLYLNNEKAIFDPGKSAAEGLINAGKNKLLNKLFGGATSMILKSQSFADGTRNHIFQNNLLESRLYNRFFNRGLLDYSPFEIYYGKD